MNEVVFADNQEFDIKEGASASRRKFVEYIVPDICVRGASAKRRRSGRYD